MAAPTRVSRHLVEWSLLVTVVLVVVALLMRQTLVVRSQAELAAVKTTIAALRTAMALHQLETQVARQTASVAPQQRNPFALLQRKPANYVGEMDLTSAENSAFGSWIFEPVCGCVGYLPIDEKWDSGPNGAKIIWLRVSAPTEPPQLVVLEAYQWRGQTLD
jgi:hypothetical protein